MPNKHFNSNDYDSAAMYRKLRQKIMYTTKGPTYERRNKHNCDRKPLMPELQNLRTRRYFHPRKDRSDRIQNSLEIATARYYLQSPSNSSTKRIQPSPSLSAAKRQVRALAIKMRLQRQRPLQQCGADEDGPTKLCGRIKRARREWPCPAQNQQILQE